MKIFKIAAGIALFTSGLACFAQTDVTCGQTIDAQLQSGAELTIDARPAGIEIVGTDKEAIHVSCKGEETDSEMRTHLRFSGTPMRAKLSITGDHLKHDNLQIRVEVPRRLNLGIQMPAGQVTVGQVVGSKDIRIYAGQITISPLRPRDYKDVDVSVGVGQVNAQAFGTEKGGFFRNFKKKNPDGEYRLYVHVTTGQVDLLGKTSGAEGPE